MNRQPVLIHCFALCALALIVSGQSRLLAQGTAITYQGRLKIGATASSGSYDFSFTLYSAEVGGSVVAGPVTNSAVLVTNGLITTTIDFGPGVFVGTARWLEIGLATNGNGIFNALAPRQQLTPVPYAVYAETSGGLAAGSGITSLNGLKDGVSLSAGTNITLTTNGNALTISSTGGGATGGVWSLIGSSAVYNNGNVGIGSSSPASRLEIAGQDALGLIGYQPFLTLKDSNANGNRARIAGVGGSLVLMTENYLAGANTFSFLTLNNDTGNVGIGSSTPQSKLEVVGQDGLAVVGYQPFLTLKDSNANYVRSRIQGVNGSLTFETEAFVNGSAPNAYAALSTSGNFSVSTLTIRGGADLAEPFEMSTDQISQGSVVVIDDENPGRLKLSERGYDTRVAGIVSGANGINPGISLRQEGALDSGKNVALSGRVYVKADASHGSIKPGDLLTTADLPGYAMKVMDPARAQGAILGKAMSSLEAGKGMVLVLVTLQ